MIGTYHTVASGSCYAYLRELDGARSLIVMNLSDSAITADLDLGSARILAATHETNAIIDTRHLALRANQGVVAALT